MIKINIVAEKLKALFLKENIEYDKNQFWVLVLKEPYKANDNETMGEFLKHSNWAMRYPLDDFLKLMEEKDGK